MTDYRDPSPITPIFPEYIEGKVPEEIRKHSTFVREKQFGVDVREAIARAVDLSGIIASEAKKESSSTLETIEKNKEQINTRLDSLITGIEQPSEVVDARQAYSGKVHPVLSARLNEEAELTKQKSTLHFSKEAVLEMDSHDVGILLYRQVSETQTVCFSNMSSEGGSPLITLTVIKELPHQASLQGLVFAKIGENERYDYRSAGAVL
ncbi:alpha-amylase [Listeria monocytogenes]|nr:alpha-amylase [Listeria monocytogenes]EIN8847530.1 alpha-amylase [Listeria monocytogenes]EKG2417595.1 alpha-amylase [Listeria monocytogenes]